MNEAVSSTGAGSNGESGIAVVRGFNDALARGDVAGMVDFLDPQVEWRAPESVPWGGTFRGRDGFREFLGKIADQPHFDRSPHTASDTRPPGRNTLYISRKACSGSGMYMSPRAQRATSMLASGRANVSASMRENMQFDIFRSLARRPAAFIILSERSMPSTCPFGPTARAAPKETSPVPQAISSTRSPTAGDANANRASCASANCACHRDS